MQSKVVKLFEMSANTTTYVDRLMKMDAAVAKASAAVYSGEEQVVPACLPFGPNHNDTNKSVGEFNKALGGALLKGEDAEGNPVYAVTACTRVTKLTGSTREIRFSYNGNDFTYCNNDILNGTYTHVIEGIITLPDGAGTKVNTVRNGEVIIALSPVPVEGDTHFSRLYVDAGGMGHRQQHSNHGRGRGPAVRWARMA